MANVEKEKMKEKGSFSEMGLADGKAKLDPYASKADPEKLYRGSQSPKRYKLRDDFEKKMAEFHKEGLYGKDDLEEPEKKVKGKGRKESNFDEDEDDEPKFLSKTVSASSKSQDDDRAGKWEGLVFLSTSKEKQRKPEEMEEESYTEQSKKEERQAAKRAEAGHRGFVPEKNFRVTTYKAGQEKNAAAAAASTTPASSSPPSRKALEGREKLSSRGEGLASGKSSFSITRETQVNLRMDSFDEDLARWEAVFGCLHSWN